MPRWKPPTHRPDLALYIQRFDRDMIERCLSSVIASMAVTKRYHWTVDRVRLWREQAFDGLIQDLIYRTKDFAEHCGDRGVNFPRVYVCVHMLRNMGVINEEEFNEIWADLPQVGRKH